MQLAAAGGSGFADDSGSAARRIAAGIALSLLVHALVLTLQRSPSQRDTREAPRPIAVRLRPPPPPPPAPPLEAVPSPTPAAPAARPAQPRRPPRVIAVPPQPAAPSPPDPFVVEQAPGTPRFDLDAARKMARSLSNMRDPAREGTAVGQFPDKPLETETRAARAIGAAKRRNCKDGVPGGLLAPLLLLADKKDSGCKW